MSFLVLLHALMKRRRAARLRDRALDHAQRAADLREEALALEAEAAAPYRRREAAR